ncbi:MAG TPA: hypothetical protein VFD24_08500 [Chitinophagaceae bacterium]|jgi:hypothetical protein|nr:hypothetical protein [Chitinophagaceae bacterium]
MEVPHHPHTERKKWTHYLWEFLMLFLAVFCGFLAENQREHMIEHERERQYSKQLLADLRKDSAFFKRRMTIIDSTFEKSWIKELFAQQKHPADSEIIAGFLKEFWSFDVSLTNSTFIQMKTSGSLRYVRSSQLTSELQKYYDVLSERVITQSGVAESFFNDYMLPWYLRHIKAQDLDAFEGTILKSNTAIIDRTEKTDQEVLNITDAYRVFILSVHEKMYRPAALQADSLITMIKKEYDLK